MPILFVTTSDDLSDDDREWYASRLTDTVRSALAVPVEKIQIFFRTGAPLVVVHIVASAVPADTVGALLAAVAPESAPVSVEEYPASHTAKGGVLRTPSAVRR